AWPNPSYVAEWSAGEWTMLHTGSSGSAGITAIAVFGSGDLIAAERPSSGMSRLVRWDGEAWVEIAAGISGSVSAMVTTTAGDIIVGGAISEIGRAHV